MRNLLAKIFLPLNTLYNIFDPSKTRKKEDIKRRTGLIQDILDMIGWREVVYTCVRDRERHTQIFRRCNIFFLPKLFQDLVINMFSFLIFFCKFQIKIYIFPQQQFILYSMALSSPIRISIKWFFPKCNKHVRKKKTFTLTCCYKSSGDNSNHIDPTAWRFIVNFSTGKQQHLQQKKNGKKSIRLWEWNEGDKRKKKKL